jgi:hypothetical protein
VVRKGTIALAAGLFVAVGSCSPAYGAGETTASVYRAFTPHGFIRLHTQARSGYCISGSGATPRRDAWRCFSGNYVLDPCFSLHRSSDYVICPESPWSDTGIKVRLTSPLPLRYGGDASPTTRLHPWALELANGRHCAFSTGATNVVEGERLNYFCGRGTEEGLWGFPDRSSEPWTILIAHFEATELTERVDIRRAWM